MISNRAMTLLLAALVLAACDTTTDPTQGSIEVTASTSGEDLDPDGYMVAVGSFQQDLNVNSDTVTFGGLTAGQIYSVTISDVADNCSLSGGNTRSAPVVFGPPTVVSFTVDCAAIP
jgi:ABC-type glycerol-3-phosphate transport system substrate-binding protein